MSSSASLVWIAGRRSKLARRKDSMMSRWAAFVTKFHTKPRPNLPAWAVEDTVEVEALAEANRGIEWASTTTGLLRTLRDGLVALDGLPPHDRTG
jgi:hypothetical protein